MVLSDTAALHNHQFNTLLIFCLGLCLKIYPFLVKDLLVWQCKFLVFWVCHLSPEIDFWNLCCLLEGAKFLEKNYTLTETLSAYASDFLPNDSSYRWYTFQDTGSLFSSTAFWSKNLHWYSDHATWGRTLNLVSNLLLHSLLDPLHLPLSLSA